MIIGDIETGISQKLHAMFGTGYTIMLDEQKQGFKAPGFWIVQLASAHELVVSKRYRRRYNFDVHYFPQARFPVTEINEVTDALLMGLEYITAGGRLIRGSNISYEVQENVLHFFITYDLFVTTEKETIPLMETLVQTQGVKGDG